MEKLVKSVLTATLLIVTPFAAQAAITTYSSQAAFLTAAGAGTTTLDFEAQNTQGPNGATDPAAPLVIIGDVSFAQPENRLWGFGQNFYATTGLTSSYLSQNPSAPSGIDVTFLNPVYGIGMNLGIVNILSNSLDITYSLSTGEVIHTSAPLLIGTGNAMAYFGFTSDVAFSGFNVNGPSQGIALDNFTFTTLATAVPEPESYAMLLAGLGLMGFMTRRKSGKKAA